MPSTAVKNTSADPEYHEILRGLSEGSVHKNFDPYVDIDWDSPEFAVDPTDTRWIMPDEDPLGRHPGTRRSRWNARSPWGCGGRPVSPRSAWTSSSC